MGLHTVFRLTDIATKITTLLTIMLELHLILYLLESSTDQFPRYCTGQETTITPLACNEMKRANDGVVAESEIIIRGTEILPSQE